MNTGAPWPDLDEAERRVLAMQTKLHRWAIDDPDRGSTISSTSSCDPAFLVVAWDRVRDQRGRTHGGRRWHRSAVHRCLGAGEWLSGLRDALKARRFAPSRGAGEGRSPRRRARSAAWVSRPPPTGSCRPR